MTRRPDGTLIYTPFPNYEKEITDGGAVTERTTYTIAGQMVAIRSAGVLYYTYTDHLGSVVAMSWLGGTYRDGSLARYDPFGNYRTTPAINPGTTNHGFTGHRHNNTGANNLGLIYMNARYYLPEVGRFISPDSIVPDPANPQSYNRYSYVRNSPLNFTDPTGHRECLNSDASGCTRVEPHHRRPLPRPAFIPTTKFNTFPVDPSQVTSGVGMQGFGDTEYAYKNRLDEYRILGRLHGGWDIPVPQGTAMLALGQGKVVCVGIDCCINPVRGGGIGLAIYYNSCACVVIYLHLQETFVAADAEVSLGMVVGKSGKDANGFEHLHLEIRPERTARTFYNPLYFFSQSVLSSIPYTFDDYFPGSDPWRIYGYTSIRGSDTKPGSYWNNTLPELWVKYPID